MRGFGDHKASFSHYYGILTPLNQWWKNPIPIVVLGCLYRERERVADLKVETDIIASTMTLLQHAHSRRIKIMHV
jgi:hypothetical protein